jgi:hypothetical protein
VGHEFLKKNQEAVFSGNLLQIGLNFPGDVDRYGVTAETRRVFTQIDRRSMTHGNERSLYRASRTSQGK